MTQFEYRVVPAPVRGIKARGARTPEDRFAQALAEVMNDLGRDGWEYVRCDTLPSEERTGLTGRTTVYRNMLVFRRAAQSASGADPAPAAAAPASFAARMAATLRPGSSAADRRSSDPGTRDASRVASPAGTDAETSGDTAPAVPTLGPADRGQAGAAPRLVVSDHDEPSGTRARPDGTTSG